MFSDTHEQQESKLEQQAQAIYDHIVGDYNRPIVLGNRKPIEDLNPEELTELVEKEFKQCGFNYIIVGNFNSYGSTKINLQLKTREPLHEIDEVEQILRQELEGYLSTLKRNCKSCKAKIYDLLLAYQDEQKRKKALNPFS